METEEGLPEPASGSCARSKSPLPPAAAAAVAAAGLAATTGGRGGRGGKGGRKNANHLLNFVTSAQTQVEMRRQRGEEGEQHRPHNSASRRRRRAGAKGAGEQLVNITREQYLRAAYQYLLLPRADGSLFASMLDTDSPLEWDAVDVTVVTQEDEGGEGDDEAAATARDCPICLHPPRTPRMTKCGHIFCYSCILRHLSDPRQNRCPMCYANSEVSDLRGVLLRRTSSPLQPGREAHFSLLRRPRSSLVPVLASEGMAQGEAVEGIKGSEFCRISVADPSAVICRILKDQDALAHQRQDCIRDGDTEELPYIGLAQELLAGRLNALKSTRLYDSNKASNAKNLKMNSNRHASNGEGKQSNARGEGGGGSPAVAAAAAATAAAAGAFYSFYQVSGGLCCAYLHPLNMKCLLEEARQDVGLLPDDVAGTILEVESIRLTGETRRRYPFLSHLPEHSIISFCEINLKKNLSKATLEKYGVELSRRHQRRVAAAREMKKEKERERKALEDMQKRVAALRMARVDLAGPPPWAADEAVQGEGEQGTSQAVVRESNHDERNMSSDSQEAGSDLTNSSMIAADVSESNNMQLSFARVAGKAAPSTLEEFPALGGPSPTTSTPSASSGTVLAAAANGRGAWGVAQQASAGQFPSLLREIGGHSAKRRGSRGTPLLSNASTRRS